MESTDQLSGFTAQSIGHGAVSNEVHERCLVEVSPYVVSENETSISGRGVHVAIKGQDGTLVLKGRLKQGQYHFTDDCTAVLSMTQDGRPMTVLLQAGQNTSAAALKRVIATALTEKNWFDEKTDTGSSDMYFHYYGMLQHQQNMLQDTTRTGTYFWAIMRNQEDFAGKVVVDVGAGSGILSLFASQAGARKVYAVEASNMHAFARQLAAKNGATGARVEVVHSKIEALKLPEKADVLISEPMGTLLLNERMLETYIHARKNLLKPGGKLFPSLGRIYVAAFQDHALHTELSQKALFWVNPSFYGVDLTPLHSPALEGYHNQVVVDAFDPGILMSTWAQHTVDFMTAEEEDLHNVDIPLQLVCKGPCVIHGVACWFDVLFPGSTQPMWLSTAPGMATTHWFQLRCVLQQPLRIVADGAMLSGSMRMVAHARQSYDIHLELRAPPLLPGSSEWQVSKGSFDLKEPYYRQLVPGWWNSGGSADTSAHTASL